MQRARASSDLPRDQAFTLRQKVELSKLRGTSAQQSGQTRVVSFTGGKGGVGKTNTVVNFGIALAKRGKNVLILDADLGLANVDVLLGVSPKRTISDVLFGECSLEEVIVAAPQGLSIIPAASGVENICSLTTEQRLSLMQEIERVAARYDYLLIDTQAGIGSEVMFFNSASTEIVCVITPDPTSLTDAYALIKVLCQNYGEREIRVLVNEVDAESTSAAFEAGKEIFNRMNSVVQRYLSLDLSYLGAVPFDTAVTEAIRNQQALLELFPSSPAARAIEHACGLLDEEFFKYRVKGGMQFFFRNLLELGGYEQGAD